MAICRSCGVEVDQGLAACPLCGACLEGADPASQAPAAQAPDARSGAAGAPFPPASGSARPQLDKPPAALRRWLVEAVTILAGAAAIVVFAADFAYRMHLTWSVYPLAAIGFLWVSALAAIAMARRVLLWLACQTLALLAFLYGLDALTAGRPWFAGLALPAALLAVVLAAATVAAARGRAGAPLSATALGLLAVGLYLLGLEQILNRYAARVTAPGWSLVAFGCILPVVLVLLFLRRSLRSRPELRKLFHL